MTKVTIEAKALVMLGKDEIKADQDVIRVQLTDLDQRIHNNAIQCFLHAEKHGDTSLMQRLLVEVLETTGYRRVGLVNWMRTHTPIEMKGKVLNLSGVDGTGAKRPWKIAEANATPFWLDRRNDEGLKYQPIFKDTALSPVLRVVKSITESVSNTADGQPINKALPFYDGLHSEAVVSAMAQIKAIIDGLPADDTREVRLAQARVAKDTVFIEERKENVAPLKAVA